MPAILVCLFLAVSAAGQEPLGRRVASLLPSDAQIIETANVPVHGKARALVLWMKAPRRVMSTWDSAAEFVHGDHWFGPTFVSLIDSSNGRLINTITIRPHEKSPGGDDLSIPFFTTDERYFVPHPDKDHKGKPVLLHLRDFTGEGVAGQFLLCAPVVSGIAAATVLGYSPSSDAAMQYPVESTQSKFTPVVNFWASNVFDTKPIRAGHWKFTWEAGHGSWAWIDEEVHFDPVRQRFVEKKMTRPYPGYAQVHCDLDTKSLPDFLGRVQKVALDKTETEWLQNLIPKAPPTTIGAAATGSGLTFAYQLSSSGAIGIEISADSRRAAELRGELKTWCPAN